MAAPIITGTTLRITGAVLADSRELVCENPGAKGKPLVTTGINININININRMISWQSVRSVTYSSSRSCCCKQRAYVDTKKGLGRSAPEGL